MVPPLPGLIASWLRILAAYAAGLISVGPLRAAMQRRVDSHYLGGMVSHAIGARMC